MVGLAYQAGRHFGGAAPGLAVSLNRRADIPVRSQPRHCGRLVPRGSQRQLGSLLRAGKPARRAWPAGWHLPTPLLRIHDSPLGRPDPSTTSSSVVPRGSASSGDTPGRPDHQKAVTPCRSKAIFSTCQKPTRHSSSRDQLRSVQVIIPGPAHVGSQTRAGVGPRQSESILELAATSGARALRCWFADFCR
jgi:hypothetical protein